MEIRSPKYTQDFFNGVIEGKNVQKYIKKYSEIKDIYAEYDKRIDLETEMYKVYSIKDNKEATMLWGLTILHPITINDEYNMTRGHFHKEKSEPEIYFGLSGEGILLFMDENGECFGENVSRGSIHYIDGKYAHRLINTSDTDLKVGACWNEIAGHDYESIEKKGFSERIFKNRGE